MTLGQTQRGHEVASAYAGCDLTPVDCNASHANALKWLMTVQDPTERLLDGPYFYSSMILQTIIVPVKLTETLMHRLEDHTVMHK